MSSPTTRRQFLTSSSLITAGILGAPYIAKAQNKGQKLKFALIGAGGRGRAGVGTAMGEEFVAIADVDWKRAGKTIDDAKKKFPNIQVYTDYRKLFDNHKDLDAVWVATPDHNHFPASIRALESGAAVYCEKPLAHALWEARRLRDVAAAKKLPTQMGNQGHSSESIRLIVEYIRSGALGEVTKLHCVSNRSFGAKSRPASKPVPEGLDWQSWLGPAPYRDYHDGLHPFSWRGWLEFGTGSLGDMGCHTIDGAVWGLKLYEADKVEVEAERGGVSAEGFNGHARIVYRFPARGDLPPATLTWWNGGSKEDLPPRPEVLEAGRKQLTQGTYYYGTKAVLMSGSHCQGVRIIPEARQKEIPKPEQMLARVPGHAQDWIRACKDTAAPAPSSNFGYSAGLTEIVLLGTVALRTGEKLVYDMKQGRFTNSERANALLKCEPRKGWEAGYSA